MMIDSASAKMGSTSKNFKKLSKSLADTPIGIALVRLGSELKEEL